MWHNISPSINNFNLQYLKILDIMNLAGLNESLSIPQKKYNNDDRNLS